jgi:hypothetical protein
LRNFGVNHAEGGQVTPKADKSRQRRTSHAKGGQVTPKADKSAKSLVRHTGVRLYAMPLISLNVRKIAHFWIEN